MKGKKLIVIVVVILIIIISIFLNLYYKNIKIGNTIINKSEEQIIEDVLNIKSYEAKVDIKIQTNKNETKYVVNQVLNNGIAKQEVIEPQNIAGVITEYDGNNLKIRNNKLDLETTFQDYEYVVENSLWLDSFIEEYKKIENKNKTVIGNEIILEVTTEENIYNYNKKLYIDKTSSKPIKLIIEDVNKKTLVYILYTEIKIS